MERKTLVVGREPRGTANKDNDDIIYYNVLIPFQSNAEGRPSIAQFKENRTQAIVNNPSEYQISIVRFTIPSSEIPIFIFNIQDYPNTNPDLSPWSVTFSFDFNGTDVSLQQYLIYSADNNESVPDGPSANHTTQNITPYYYVKSYQHFLDIINVALSQGYQKFTEAIADQWSNVTTYLIGELAIYNNIVYISLTNANTNNQPDTSPLSWKTYAISTVWNGAVTYNKFDLVKYTDGVIYMSTQNANLNNLPTDAAWWAEQEIAQSPPYFIFNSETRLISLIAEKKYATEGTNQPISIYSNHILYTNFFNASLQIYDYGYGNDDGKDVLYYIKNNNNNEYKSDYYEMKQEFSTLYSWNSFKTIVFATGTIPIKNEYIPTSSQNPDGSINILPILTDFEPPQEENLRTVLQYNPTAEYRMADLMGTSPLVKFDVRIYWTDNYQNLYPVYLPAHDGATIKFLFRKKNYIERKNK